MVSTGPDSEPGINGGIMGAQQFPLGVINTVQVKSLAAAQAKIEAAGGKLVFGPLDIPGVGNHTYFADLDGILFGIL